MFASVSSVQSKFQCSLYTSDVFHFTTIIENYNVCKFFFVFWGGWRGGVYFFLFSYFIGRGEWWFF